MSSTIAVSPASLPMALFPDFPPQAVNLSSIRKKSFNFFLQFISSFLSYFWGSFMGTTFPLLLTSISSEDGTPISSIFVIAIRSTVSSCLLGDGLSVIPLEMSEIEDDFPVLTGIEKFSSFLGLWEIKSGKSASYWNSGSEQIEFEKSVLFDSWGVA